MADNSAYAAAELATGLRGDDPGEPVRTYAGLVDDPEKLGLLNHLDSVLEVPVEESRIGQEIIQNTATATADRAVRNGAVSQMKAATGLTNQTRDGGDLYGEAAAHLSNEGAIGLVFGPPGAGKTVTTIDVAQAWRIRTGGTVIGNTTWDGFDAMFTSDTEMLAEMGSHQGPVLAVVDEAAQDLSGFGSGNKRAEAFSNSLLFIRKREREHGEYAKKGSVLMVSHTRKKTAKSIRRVASFGIEKPSRSQPDRARLLESEGGRDEWKEVADYQGLTDTSESYREYEASEFVIEGHEDDFDDEDDDGLTDREKDIITAVRAVIGQGQSPTDAQDLVDYSRSWVSKRVGEWRDGEHRELIDEDEI